MPHLGIYHDDSLYFVTAKSWAEGKGHRIESFPGEPAQTKYPPGLPLLLSLVWRINPRFPENLPLLMLLVWTALPLFLAGAAFYFRDLGFGVWKTALLCAWLAVTPVVIGFSTMAMTELWFGAQLAVIVALTEQLGRPGSRWWWALGTGGLVAAAALTRSAGVFLLASVPIGLVWRRRFKETALFLAAAAPPLAAWNLWKLMHPPPSGDLVTLYYTSYSAYQLATVGLWNPALTAPYNLNTLFTGLGKLFVFFDENSLGVVTVGRVLAVGAIVGAVRLVRRTGKPQFALFALVYGAVMMIWHFPPDVRFITPLAPLLFAGFAEEAGRLRRQLAVAWHGPGRSNRAAAAGVAALLLAGGAWWARQTWYGATSFLPAAFQERQRALEGSLPAYDWVRKNTAPATRFFAYDDAVFYLYTGRHACSLAIPPNLVYHNDEEGVVRFVESMPKYARRFGIQYVLLTATDFRLSPTGAARRGARALARDTERLQLVFAAESSRIYRLTADVGGPAKGVETTELPSETEGRLEVVRSRGEQPAGAGDGGKRRRAGGQG